MRVIHAVATQEFAGVERHVARLAQAQAARGDDVLVLGGDAQMMARAAGAGSFAFEPVASIRDLARALVRVSRPSCDVVNTHLTAADAVAAAVVPSRVALISTRHIARRRGSRLPTRLALRPLMRRVDQELAVSSFVAARIGVPSRVVLTGVPTMPDVVSERRRSVLVAQRLSTEKQTDLAVQAFHRSGLWSQGWTLDLAGTGTEQPALEQLARSYGIADAVRFLGFRSDVGELMTTAGILLAPHDAEALGISVLEAMAVGLPVIASAAGGHLETVGSVSRDWLFRPGDANSAGQALHTLAADEQGRAAYGLALREQQRLRFTLERQAEDTDRVYREAM